MPPNESISAPLATPTLNHGTPPSNGNGRKKSTMVSSEESLSTASYDDSIGNTVVYTESEVLVRGLLKARFTLRRIKRAKAKTNRERFESHYGVTCTIAVRVFHDLQQTAFDDARVDGSEINLDHFLMALYFLKLYPKEAQIEALFDLSPKWARMKIWRYAKAIQALKQEKIVWPEFDEDEIWVVSVDGIHCWIREPEHPTWSRDSTFFSHKYNKAGMGYELGIHLWEPKLIWMKGPHKAGKNDAGVFKANGGLRDKLLSVGKKAIGDLGYRGHQDVISVPNVQDSRPVKLFKSRASMRHETFNGIIKEFGCLAGRFRHDADKFKTCFEAVCVLAQYKLEMGRPLFDILIEAVFNDESDSVADDPPDDATIYSDDDDDTN